MSIEKIAIIDDDKSAAELTSLYVEDAGFEPLMVVGPVSSLDELTSYIIKQKVQGALCDHRLSHHGFANFYGASLVASLYERNIPAVLITQFVEIDKDVSIRKWRRKIPVLLSRDEADTKSIKNGIEYCEAELRGDVPIARKPHRALFVVTEKTTEGNENVIDIIIPSWNPKRAVRLPLALVPSTLHENIRENVWLFAQCNIGAEKSEDLYFEGFELAGEVDLNDGLA